MGISSTTYLAAVLAVLLAGCGNSSSGSGGSSDTQDGGTDLLGRTVGDACTDPTALVCGLDDMRVPTGDVLACEKGALVKSFTCPGGTCGTLTGHSGVRCGTSTFVAIGGACDTEGSAACVPDATVVALCHDKTWIEGHHCGSPICAFLPGSDGMMRAQCGPEDLYSVGDSCAFPFGHGICSVDHSAVLDCKSDGTAQVLYACKDTQTCMAVEVDGGTGIECYPPMTSPLARDLTARDRSGARGG